MMQTKTCSKCFKTKKISGFRNQRLACRECEKIGSRISYWKNREHNLKVMSKYQKEHKAEIREQRRRHYLVNKERITQSAINWVKNNPEKYQKLRKKHYLKARARWLVNNALVKGVLLKKPCEQCAAVEVHAHHTDYSKPLEVTWLCPPCHSAEHRGLVPLHQIGK